MPEPLHADWCSSRSSAEAAEGRSRLFSWTLALGFVTSCLGWYGMSQDPWIGEGGGHPLIWFGLPFLFGAVGLGEAGLGCLAIPCAVLLQLAACLPVAWLMTRPWSRTDDSAAS